MKPIRFSFLICCFVVLTSCSSMYLPKGDLLYTKTEVKIVGDSIKSSQKKMIRASLKDLVRPAPNLSIFGFRPKLLAYNIAGTPKKEKGLRYWLKNKIGEPPVLASTVNFQMNREILQNRLENQGFFQDTITTDTTSVGRHLKATYIVKLGNQYHIRTVQLHTDSSDLGKAITAIFHNSILKPGKPYNLDVIKGERERINQVLKEQGFYYFSPDNLLVRVDSTVGQNQVDLYMTIKPQISALAKKRYVMGAIRIYPNYNTRQSIATEVDSVFYDGFYVIDKKHAFNPSVFSRSIRFKSGELYNKRAYTMSLSRLMSVGAFKLVTSRFEIDQNASKPTLDVFYYLTPSQRKSIRVELLATTKSNNLAGTELSLSWRNRNTFGGAEQLQIRVYGGLELQIGGVRAGYHSFRLGTESSLSFPEFILPFVDLKTVNAYVPHTKFVLGFEMVEKPLLYRLKSFRLLAGYSWKENIRIDHELNPLSINFVQANNITSKFREMIQTNQLLAKTIEKQFIVGTTYSFTYTDQMENTRRNNLYFNGNIDLAGNVLGLVQGANVKAGDTATIFGVAYSQYARFDVDLRYYYKTGPYSKLVGRVFAGVGIPNGNSSELPYIKQYYAGGSNSNRAFMARSIGPGTFRQADSGNNYYPDQSGDIKLEANAEYRTKLFNIVHGALFVDASNVWLFNESADKPGANFNKDFLNELAVGAGAGLRFDFSFLVLRLDLAIPLSKPWLEKGNRWVMDRVDFASKQWRKDNLAFNLAIGYPF